MIIHKKETITSFQLFFYMVIAQLNMGIFIIPMILYKYGKHDGWISILVSCFFSICLVILYSFIHKRFPNLTIYEICKLFFGKWIGGLLIISYILYFIYISFLINQFYLSSFSKWVFPNTPYWGILLLLLVIGVYLGKESLRTMTRLFQLTFWAIFIIFLFSLDAYQSIDWKYLLPIGQVNSLDILNGSYHTIFLSAGFECLLVVYPFVKDHHRKTIKSTVFSVLFVTIIYLFIVILCIGFFSPKEMKLIPEPTIYLFKTLTFFQELERLDLLFLSIWFVVIASSYVVYLFLASVGISNLLNLHKNQSLPIFTICLIIFLGGNFLPVSRDFMQKLLTIFSFASVCFLIVIPLLILCISLLFKIKSKEVKVI
ncbi:endospore germination permease [Gottfriedia sp. NPDC056225]|uniref:GerAB/ArcD/ProY family transporter n=1 Tax=Gottfriedia sp. NPDC056225 TaxID=3345751 RepID=UPI00155992CE|nr:endospore germination permease [Arthrobacter citreus]